MKRIEKPGHGMYSRFCLSLAIFLLGVCSAVMAAPVGKGPVLAIGPIWDEALLNEIGGPTVIGVRDNVVTELVNSYHCYVVSRARNFDVALEEDICRFSAIDKILYDSGKVRAADYVISVSYYPTTRRKSVHGTVRCLSLADGRDNRSIEARFASPSMAEAHVAIAGCVAEMLRLEKKAAGTVERVRGRGKKRAWTVLPFQNFSAPACSTAFFTDAPKLSLRVEKALQDSGRPARMVDRRAIDRTLEELKIKAIVGLDRNAAGTLGRLVGADRIVMGNVAGCGEGLRLNLQLIDAGTSLVVDGRSAVRKTEDELSDCASSLALELAMADGEPPDLASSSKEQRKREAQFYLDWTDGVAVRHAYSQVSHWACRLAALEAVYLLTKDDPLAAYDCGSRMTLVIEHTADQPDMRPDFSCTCPAIGKRAAYLVNRIMETIEHSDKTPHPLLWRSYALRSMGRSEEALALAEQHASEYPQVNPEMACRLRIRCCLKLGRADEAESLLNKFVRLHGWDDTEYNFAARIARMRHDDKAEYEALSKWWGPDHEMGAGDIQEEVWRFIDLWNVYEKPEIVLASIDHRTNKKGNDTKAHGAPRSWALMIAAARSYRALGRNVDAARMCKDVLASTANATWGPDDRSRRSMARSRAAELLREIEKEVGQVAEIWSAGRQVRPIPDRFRICLVPVGDTDQRIVTNTVARLAAFWGTGVQVLGTVPLHEEDDPEKDNHIWDPKELFSVIAQRAVIPDDAVFVVFFTGKTFPGGGRECFRAFTPGAWNPVLASYGYDWGDTPRCAELACNSLAKYILWAFRNAYSGKPILAGRPDEDIEGRPGFACGRFPCVFARPDDIQRFWLRFSMCPECQAEYKKVDFDKIHNDLIKYLKKSGAKIVKTPPRT